jgi:transketolase
MRNAVFGQIAELAKQDKDLMVIVADMGAPALDNIRVNFPNQFIDVGISEQAMVAFAAGLALSGKKVFTYAIAAFAVSRCYEALKVNFAYTGLPLTVIGVGAGYTYWESGPTHHAWDDTALMQLLGATIYQPVNDEQARQMTRMAYESPGLKYIRLPRVPGKIFKKEVLSP